MPASSTTLWQSMRGARAEALQVLDNFEGNWDLAFVIRRYLATFRKHLTPPKLANVGLAMAELSLARPRVHSRPFMLRLEPTSTCNLRCPRCSTGLGIEPRPKGFLSLEDLDFLLERVKEHMVVVRFDGNGEPLLHPKAVSCIERISRSGLGVDISTHLNTPPAEGLEALVESGLDRIMVAVDGATQEVYERYRVGGKLDRVLNHVQQLVDAREKHGRGPLIELQFLDWGYNAHQIPDMQRLAKSLGVDRLTMIRPDNPVDQVKVLPENPRRCFWLWCVLTVDWQLNLHSCTNAWTYAFPELNLKALSVADAWNSQPFQEARRFNKNKQSDFIQQNSACMCNRCTDMLVVKRPPGYVCE